MAYKISTLKNRPGTLNRINLGELTVEVRVNDRAEMLELLSLTRNVTVVIKEWLGEELREFREIRWKGGHPVPRELATVWSKLCRHSRGDLAWDFPEQALRDRDPLIAAWAVHATSDASALMEMASSPFKIVREAVAQNLHTPPEALELLSRDSFSEIVLNVAANTNCSPDTLARLASHHRADVRAIVAGNVKTPKDTLAVLGRDPDISVRRRVVIRTDCPVEVLEELSRDTAVLWDLSQNPRCPAYILERLVDEAFDTDYLLMERIASNRSCPHSLLRKLASSEGVIVRSAVAVNPSTPPDILKRLSQDANSLVRLEVAYNPSCPEYILEALSRDPEAKVRSVVAEGPATPLRIVRRLSRKDDSDFVRRIAHRRLRLSRR